MGRLTARSPLLTVDVIIRRQNGSVVLVKRRKHPFKGLYAIPGGFVEYGEKVEGAAEREAEEETGLKVRLTKLKGVYSDPGRDPRGHVVSIVYLAEEIGGRLKAGSDAQDARAFRRLPKKLAFDHDRILRATLGGS